MQEKGFKQRKEETREEKPLLSLGEIFGKTEIPRNQKCYSCDNNFCLYNPLFFSE